MTTRAEFFSGPAQGEAVGTKGFVPTEAYPQKTAQPYEDMPAGKGFVPVEGTPARGSIPGEPVPVGRPLPARGRRSPTSRGAPEESRPWWHYALGAAAVGSALWLVSPKKGN